MHDYSICPDNADGKHRPRPAPANDESGTRYEYILTVECSSCFQTTGVPMPSYEDIDW